ncbi:Histidinol dehydrogenase [Candidatus Hodgkinia cicadicola]|uniref:Histidinol dehydrogenase n=1 Tax=Candidatus Hodgkinia cicadicola TaxID=573658 RepID=A0ABX4MFD8_9HYPH|nr:Histidinol dehydrogenase [Candidatus Hodgkinia cicadicola]
MSLRLRSDSPLFDKFIDGIMADRTLNNQHVDDLITRMEELISKYSDKALMAYNEKLDNVTSRLLRIKVIHDIKGIDLRVLFEIKTLYDRLLRYHSNQVLRDKFYVDKDGVILGSIWKPLSSIGIYVPGGEATYISSMFMSAIPARLAGIKHIYVATPYHKIKDKRLFMACASICGVECIYTFGGPQAIIAMALGTETVKRVDKITGPGNIYVTSAKKKMFGKVGIDGLTGPSESVIIADKSSDTQQVSVDLAAQLEHDKSALAVLITKTPKKASAVRSNINALMSLVPSDSNIKYSWSNYGLTIVCKSSTSLYNIVRKISPEHLHINTSNAFEMMKWIHSAGSIFIGRHTPIAIGDYAAGCNHILPTNTTSRFSSGLSVLDFMTRKSVTCLPTLRSLRSISSPCIELALMEKMDLHALSIGCRLHAVNNVGH